MCNKMTCHMTEISGVLDNQQDERVTILTVKITALIATCAFKAVEMSCESFILSFFQCSPVSFTTLPFLLLIFSLFFCLYVNLCSFILDIDLVKQLLSSSCTSVPVKQGLFNAKIHHENGRCIHRLIYELNEQDLLGHSR